MQVFLRGHSLVAATLVLLISGNVEAARAPESVDQILKNYVDAVGGQAALDKVTTREVEIAHVLGVNAKLYWMAPDKVLWRANRERQGFDGSGGWYATKRKRIKKLERSRQDEIETNVNPLRFTQLHALYHELDPAPAESLDGQLMNIIVAPNSIGATKFFFDTTTHLLVRIEDFGALSAYFHHTIEFADYKEMDGIRLPLRIEKQTDEPGAETGEIRLTHVKQNQPLDAVMFRKPDLGGVLTGGKH